MNVGVSLLCLKYPATLKKTLLEMLNILFHKQKVEMKNYVPVVTLLILTFLVLFFFQFPPFSMSFLYYLLCETKNYFLGGSHLFGDSFFIFKENTL